MIMIRRLLLASLAAHYTSGFTVPSSHASTSTRTRTVEVAGLGDDHHHDDAIASFDPLDLASVDAPASGSSHGRRAAILAAAATSLSSPLAAHAAGPDWGIFEGRTGSLLHPAAMLSTFALSLSTALLGWQWRRQRTMGDEIAALKKSLPPLNGAKTVAEALAAADGARAEGEEGAPDAAQMARLRAALPVANQIAELTQERKDLAKASPRDQHFGQGSLLLFIGIAFAIEVSCLGRGRWCGVTRRRELPTRGLIFALVHGLFIAGTA